MELSNINDDLLNSDDVLVDEDIAEDEVREDLLGLDDFIKTDETSDADTADGDDSDETDDKDSNGEQQENFVISYLKEFGIEDPKKMQFQNDSGEIEEIDFDTLSDEEKLTVLKELSDPGYTDYEKQVIDYLRRNNTTLDDVIATYQQKAIDDYLSEHPEAAHQRTYSIDEYTDDEVYLADLKNKYTDFTDEELVSKLESAKLNEDLFKREVEVIRASLKEAEDAEIARQEQEQEQSYQELQTNLQRALGDFTEIVLDPDDPSSDALEIEDEDRKVILKYLIERDKDGKSQLVRDLEDPNALIELAYYRTRERENLTGLTRYWKKELADERKEKAKLQKELDKLKGNNSFVVTQPKQNNKQNNKKTVYDIYG